MSNHKMLMAKKSLILVAAGISAIQFTSLFAGGVEIPPPPSQSGIYLEADVGYTGTDWTTIAGGGPGANGSVFQFTMPTQVVVSTRQGTVFTNNARGGFAWGGDLGYQFNSYLAAEAGAFMLPTTKFQFDNTTRSGGGQFIAGGTLGTGSISYWFAYAAGKVLLPLTTSQNIALFAKAGVAYRDGSIKMSTVTFGTQTAGIAFPSTSPFSGFVPIAGAGAQFILYQNWIFNTQFLVLPSSNVKVTAGTGNNTLSSATLAIPTTYLVTVGAGYKFKT